MKIKNEILNEFEKRFCNNHQQPIRFLRSIFYDEQDGAEQIEDFISEIIDEIFLKIEKKIKSKNINGVHFLDAQVEALLKFIEIFR